MHLYRKMLNQALAEGMRVQDFSDLPTSYETIDDLQAVPADHFFYLHEFLDEQLGPGFSIRVGQEMKIDDYGVLGLSWRTCSRAGEIFERSERYFKLLSNTYVFKVEKGKELSQVYLNRDPHRRGVELSNEATLSATVVVLQAMTETEIFPVQVTFKHSEPKDISSYKEAFKCDVLFNQPNYSISYTTRDFESRTAKADTSINRFLLERVKEEEEGIEISPNRVADEVRILIEDALPSGIPSVSSVGEHLGMSNRTLTRRLSEDNLSFRDLIQQTQERVAKTLLNNSSRSISEIAFQTGFSEQSAFNRAFKRWTGQSPTDYRKTS